MSVCVPMASIVTRAPFRSRCFSSNGMAVIALDFFLSRLLSEHDPLSRRPGGDEMQGIAALPPVVAAPRGFAIDGDNVGVIVSQVADPGQEAGLEQLRVQGREHVTQRVVARDAA